MSKPRTGRDIVVIGASAGGLEPLLELVRTLPEDLPAAMFVVIHVSADSPGALPGLLERAGPFVSHWPSDAESIEHGTIYVARPDHHLLIKPGLVESTRGPQENGFRPAVDPLFRTAAEAYGPRVIGIVLSGGLDDGTYGLMVIKKYGGIAIAQDPQEAMFPGMPMHAIQKAGVHHVLKVREMSAVIARLVREPVTTGAHAMTGGKQSFVDAAEVGTSALEAKSLAGPPSVFTCPACGGALWELRDGELLRFRCHVGHSYTEKALLTAQAENLESVLWAALRALEEHAEMRRRMARRAATGHYPPMAKRFEQQAAEAEQRALLIRELLTNPEGGIAQAVADDPVRSKSRRPNLQVEKGKSARMLARHRPEPTNGRPREKANGKHPARNVSK